MSNRDDRFREKTTESGLVRRTDPLANASWDAGVVVWAVWALMLVSAVAFVGRFGNAVFPLGDEWIGLVPALTGEQPVTLEWLWSQHNEHRVLLPRLILVTAFRLTGDFRTVMFVDVVALGALAFWMIRVVNRIRGHPSYADAFFPLVLLNLAQYENLLIGWQVQMVSSTLLAGVLLCIIAGRGILLTPGWTVVAGTCLVLLPLCGANGVALVPALAIWLGYSGIHVWRTPSPKRKGRALLMLAFAIAALLLAGFYFVDYYSPSYHPPSAGLWPSLQAALEFFSGGVGETPAVAWWPYLGLGLLAGAAGGLLILVLVWWGHPPERLRVVGLCLFTGAMCSLALGMGWGRSGFGPGAGIASRYVTLAAPALCALYFVWGLHPRPEGRLAQQLLALLLVVCIWPNFRDGLEWGLARPRKSPGFFARPGKRDPPSDPGRTPPRSLRGRRNRGGRCSSRARQSRDRAVSTVE